MLKICPVVLEVLLAGCATGNRIPVPGGLQLTRTHEFQVYADRDWQKAPFEVKRSDFVRIRASGQWTDIVSVGPEGSRSMTVFFSVIPPMALGALLLQPKYFAPKGCLIAEFARGHRVAIGREFCVSNDDDYYSGRVRFRCNDSLLATNSGQLDVEVEVYRKSTVIRADASDHTENSRSAPASSVRNIYVLVIGISSYNDPSIPKLRYSHADARAIHDFFSSSTSTLAKPSNVHFLTDKPNQDGLVADKRGILLALNRYLIQRAVNEDDMVILYFAGHGDVGKHPTKGTEYYLIPQDATMSDLFVTGIELAEFERMWSAIPAKTKILIADACNSGGFSGMRGLGISGVESVGGEAKAVFSACKSDEKSMECDQLGHGLFTYVLLEGLKGKADMVCGNNDGRVTLAEFKRWLDKQVPLEARKMGGRQTPITSLVDAWGEVYLTR